MSVAQGLFDEIINKVTIDSSDEFRRNAVYGSIPSPRPDFSGAPPKDTSPKMPPELDPGGFSSKPFSVPLGPLGNPKDAAYKAITATLAIPPRIQLVQPDYGIAVHAPSLPNPALPVADLDYPQFASLPFATQAVLALPVAPDIQVGESPKLLTLDRPVYEVLSVKPFEAALPDDAVFSAPRLDDAEQVEYNDDSALIERIKSALLNGDGLSSCVLRGMGQIEDDKSSGEYAAMRDTAIKDVAARGFGMPTGRGNALLLAASEKLVAARQSATDAVQSKAFEIGLEALVQAVAQAVALESRHVALHLSNCARVIDTLKFNIKAQVQLFDAVAAVHNSKVRAIEIADQAYRRYLETVSLQDKALLQEGATARFAAENNKARSTIFAAQSGTVRAIAEAHEASVAHEQLRLEEYEAYLIGVKANAQISKHNIEGFREALSAFSASASAESEKFDAYAAHVRAEGSAQGVFESNIRAQSSYWRASGVVTDAWTGYAAANAEAIESQIRGFSAASQAQRSYIAGLAANLAAQAQANSATVSSERERAGLTGDYNELVVSVDAANNALALTMAEIETNQQALEALAKTESDKLEAGRRASDAEVATALAQSAMSVRRINTSIGASAGVNQSASDSVSDNETFGGSRSYSWGKTHSDK